MKALKIIRAHPVTFSGVCSAAVLLLCGVVIFASMTATPGNFFDHTSNKIEILTEDQDIAAWARFDQPSYQIGAVIKQQVRVLYRANKVTPDLESLHRRMSFFPLEQRSSRETTIQHGNGVTEYLLDFELQGVRVEPQNSYRIDPFTLYYSLANAVDDNIYSQVIRPPLVHIAAYYPLNMEGVNLLTIKGELDSAEGLRQFLMASGGIALLCIAVFILWHFGRRRMVMELTEEERLWRVFAAMENSSLDNRTALLNYEQIFTRLLYVQTNLTPEAFWSGEDPDDETWKSITITARDILLENYQTADPSDADVQKLKSVLGDCLSSCVTESRLRIEQQPNFRQRIGQQPAVMSYASILTVLAVVIFILNTFPDAWSSSELQDYNSLARAIQSDDVNIEESYLALSTIGDLAKNNRIKYAALYNAGTLRADKSFSMYAQGYERLILNSVIRSRSVEEMFHALLEGPFDEESQIVSILTDGAEQLRRAELDFQAAVRVNPYDEDSQRNLEIVIKRRAIVLDMIGQIRDFYRSQQEEDGEEALSDEGIINLLEAELPEDDEEESTGKDDRGYMILERF
jgi:hypothetical protein